MKSGVNGKSFSWFCPGKYGRGMHSVYDEITKSPILYVFRHLNYLGVSKGGVCEGWEISIIGVVRAPVAIINFALLVQELLSEST